MDNGIMETQNTNKISSQGSFRADSMPMSRHWVSIPARFSFLEALWH